MRTIGDLVAWFAFLTSATVLAVRFIPVVHHAILIVAALSPYLTVLFAGIALAAAVVNHRWWAAVPTSALLVAALAVQAPLFISSGRSEGHNVPIRVLTANVFVGEADPGALMRIAQSRADVLMVQELTPEFASALHRLDTDFPYKAVEPSAYGRGVGIWSRYPLGSPHIVSGYELGMLSVSIRVPGATHDAVLLAVHLAGPWPQPIDPWRKEITALPGTLRWMADLAGNGAVIAAGDFNATADMEPFRRLLDNGYRSAADQAGAGLARTYAAHESVPPLIGIDHILIRNSSASDVETVEVAGSDHLGVIATIHIPG